MKLLMGSVHCVFGMMETLSLEPPIGRSALLRWRIASVGPMAHYHDLGRELAASGRALRSVIPDVYDGFASMSRGALTDGALSRKTKELIALSISVVEQCDGCIAAHARGLTGLGATDEEVAEAIGVAILMRGGPATVYGPRAWDAWKEYKPDS